MKTVERLLKPRQNQCQIGACPTYISESACENLFKEADVLPAKACVGMLGDILENYAMLILEKMKGRKVTESDLAKALAEVID